MVVRLVRLVRRLREHFAAADEPQHIVAETSPEGEGPPCLLIQDLKAKGRPEAGPRFSNYRRCAFGLRNVPSGGGGGNRTRVRGRTVKSIYKLSLRFVFARRPVRRRPAAGLAILRSPAAGDWLSLGSEPVR